MKVQYENKVMSSMLLYVDHKVLRVGEAYTNHSGYLYETQPGYLYKDASTNFYIYSAPFKQLVSDSSITGATLASGMFVGAAHYGPSASLGPKLYSINHSQGHFYTRNQISQTGVNPRQSAAYSVKDFNVYLTSMPEEELLFETKIHLRPRITNPNTGLSPHSQTYPAIFLKNMGGFNEPFAFGGTDTTVTNVRAVVLADSAFHLDAVCSIFKDCVRDSIPLISAGDLSFDALGGSASGYNYTGIAAGKMSTNQFLNINDVSVSRNVTRGYSETVNPEIHAGFIDFRLENHREPRRAVGTMANVTGDPNPGY
jgi:hypothetical protein